MGTEVPCCFEEKAEAQGPLTTPPDGPIQEREKIVGCDIHYVVERRVSSGGPLGDRWVGVSTGQHVRTFKRREDDLGFAIPVAKERNYKRFAALAGVRGDGPKPLGLPADISDLTKLEVHGWGDDGHSHSWLTIRDAARVFLETEYPYGHGEPTEYERKYPVSHFFEIEDDDALDDYRLIFWFDN